MTVTLPYVVMFHLFLQEAPYAAAQCASRHSSVQVSRGSCCAFGQLSNPLIMEPLLLTTAQHTTCCNQGGVGQAAAAVAYASMCLLYTFECTRKSADVQERCWTTHSRAKLVYCGGDNNPRMLAGGVTCCDTGATLCGASCCPSGSSCSQGTCLQGGQSLCGGKVCGDGQSCLGGSVCCEYGASYCNGGCCELLGGVAEFRAAACSVVRQRTIAQHRQLLWQFYVCSSG